MAHTTCYVVSLEDRWMGEVLVFRDRDHGSARVVVTAIQVPGGGLDQSRQ